MGTSIDGVLSAAPLQSDGGDGLTAGWRRAICGYTAEGDAVEGLRLEVSDVVVDLLAYGARIKQWRNHGKNMVLGYDTIEEYERDDAYLGATIGRVCNRTSKPGALTLPGLAGVINLAVNENKNHHHGGKRGFDKHLWSIENIHFVDGGISADFDRLSPAGEQGYPSSLLVNANFSLTVNRGVCHLGITYRSKALHSPTYANLTSHPYFNLDGADKGSSVMDHQLEIHHCDAYLVCDDESVPTGEVKSLDESPALDCRSKRVLGERLPDGLGFDHFYVRNRSVDGMRKLATVSCASSGYTLETLSNQPGFQFYTGNHLPGMAGSHRRHSGFCVEPSGLIDSASKPDFEDIVVEPGKELIQIIEYVLEKK